MTTIFGWDTSHYDWDRGPMDVAAAKRDGVAFFTAKIGEGLAYTDPWYAAGVQRARDAGIEFIGAYYVNHTVDPAGQARRCVDLADKLSPWWRDFPGWFWQVDAEHWPDDFPPPSAVKLFADTLFNLTHRRVIIYASHGQYGNTLAGVGHPLWNASYGTDPVGHYPNVYPGDSSTRWAPYSGQVPVLLQYGSNTRIGTQPTCDANAFRGTVDDFRNLITGAQGDDVNQQEHTWLAAIETRTARLTEQNWDYQLNLNAAKAATGTDQIMALLQSGGGDPSLAPVLAAIKQLADAQTAGFAELKREHDDLRQQLNDFRRAEAEAQRAAASELDVPTT